MQETLSKREIADELIRELFASQKRITIADAAAKAAEYGVSRTTIGRAMAAAGVRTIRNGRHGGIWEMGEAA